MVSIVSVSLYQAECRADVCVRDAQGELRRIEYRWISKEPSTIPASFWDAVCAEVEFQRTAELEARMGRTLV